ncbi:Hypothetical predicted protein [Pelobates cultripes]|uniref:Uncharacterized protein n=1 Tax=Pelobates cultripes TaxID=61616 RepID=A0AAD1R8U4_PELCU|nr:Hypothetical predicted protein [Pelobates cultripes]
MALPALGPPPTGNLIWCTSDVGKRGGAISTRQTCQISASVTLLHTPYSSTAVGFYRKFILINLIPLGEHGLLNLLMKHYGWRKLPRLGALHLLNHPPNSPQGTLIKTWPTKRVNNDTKPDPTRPHRIMKARIEPTIWKYRSSTHDHHTS